MSTSVMRAVVWTLVLLASASLGARSVAAQTEVVHYYHTDGIGSVRAVTNQTGTVISEHNYQPFGEEWLPPSGSDERIRFAGKELDPETGSGGWMALNYFGARYLHTSSGRFTSVDPVLLLERGIADPQTWNRYTYVKNNPARFVDPDGRIIWFAVVAAAVAAVLTPAEGSKGDDFGRMVINATAAAVGVGALSRSLTDSAPSDEDEPSQKSGRSTNQFRGPDPKAEGYPHTRLRRGPDGTVTHYETYDYPEPGKGKRVDLVGPDHSGVPTPHVVETTKHVNPNDPTKFRYKEGRPRPATPDEIPVRPR